MRDLFEAFDRLVAALDRGARIPPAGELPRAFDGLVADPPARPAPQPGRLRVGIVCREYPPDTAFGGMATFSRHLARGLADAGHQVTVVTVGGPRFERAAAGIDVVRIAPRVPGAKESFEDLMRAGRLPYAQTVFCHGLAVLRQLELIERAQGRFDVLDLADHAAEGLVPALFHGSPTTLRLYSPYSVLAAMRSGFTPEAEHRALTLLEATLLRKCDVVTAPSRELAARTRAFFGLMRDVAFVPNPVDTELFRPVKCGAAATARPGAVRVCFVGRLEERKGIRTLLAAIPRVLSVNPDIAFTIVGDDLLGFGRAHASALPAERVRFQRPVRLEELPQVYQSADLAVVPSNYDNSPYTCIEPMACGIPVVGTTAGGIAEYVIDGETGYIVPPRDPTALADAIVRLAAADPVRRRMGDAGRARVELLFDHRRVAALMERHYRAAIAGRAFEWGSGALGRPWSPRSTLNRARPERARLEVIVRAAGGERSAVERTLASIRDQGVETTIVCEDVDLPHMPRGRVIAMTGPEGSVVRRVLSTVLADAFVVLQAGDVLPRCFAERALCTLAATGGQMVVVDGVRAFLALVALAIAVPDACGWDEALARVATSCRTPCDEAAPPALAHWERAWLADPPRASRVSRAIGCLEAALWSPPLRPLRHVIRATLAAMPRGGPLVTRVSAQRVSELLPDPDGVPRRRSALTLVGASLASAQELAHAGDPSELELWVLEELLPSPLWRHALCFLVRTRPRERLRIAADVPLDDVPDDYRAAMEAG